MIMDANKSQDLQREFASWRPRINGIISIPKVSSPRPRKSQYFYSGSEAEKSQCPRSKASRQEAWSTSQGKINFLVYTYLQLLDQAHPH